MIEFDEMTTERFDQLSTSIRVNAALQGWQMDEATAYLITQSRLDRLACRLAGPFTVIEWP